jgi:hypothetical protein
MDTHFFLLLFLYFFFFSLECWHAAVAGAHGWEPPRHRQEEQSQFRPT